MKAMNLWLRVVVGLLLVALVPQLSPTPGLASPPSTPYAQIDSLEVHALVQQVRLQTRDRACLTPLSSLKLGTVPLESEKQAALLAAVQSDEWYSDIKLVRTTKFARYLYSGRYMSDTYARILLRVEEDNPYLLIGETVRENSEVYPRPTAVDLFRLPPFNLPATEVERLARETVEREEYRDLHLIVTSMGALYLNSRRFMDPEHARSIAEMEVHQSDTP